MNRVNNPSKYLINVVNDKQPYYIGFGISQLTELAKKNLDIQRLISGKTTSIIANGNSGALKDNTNGKYVRKDPPSKTSVSRHIDYYNKRYEKQITFDREFNIWEKVLLHKYALPLTKDKTPQKETILHFPLFIMDNSEKHFLQAGAAMNMAILLGGYFMFYDSSFEPIIPVTTVKDKSILPPGNYNSVREKLEAITNVLNSGIDSPDFKGNSYRFALLKEFNPEEVTMGRGGFNEYLMFEYKSFDLVVLENLNSGNATYLFSLAKFDKNKSLDKQTARKDPSYRDRLVHENMDDWNMKMRKYFTQ